MPEPNKTKDTALEQRVKEGSSGLELLEYTKALFDCDDATATTKIHDVIQRSAHAIKELFSKDQVILMAFHLYRTALNGGRIKDAAMVLQSISIMLRESGAFKSKDNAGHLQEIKVLEYIPDQEG